MSKNALPATPILPSPVLLVEDESPIQERLLKIMCELGYSPGFIHVAGTLAEARRLVEARRFALALVDLGLPDGHGCDFIAELRQRDTSMGILVISAWSTQETILRALHAGATGYLLKERDDLEVMLSIRSVLRGGAPIDPFIARHILAELPQAKDDGPDAAPRVQAPSILTTREAQILALVADGKSNRDIAEHLQISRYTVECHITHIYRKLEVSSRTKAINEGRLRGLLQ
ncbi:response regulator transcription factor [Acidovorax sp. CCYZU-2555]|uniref:response regulator transcription factor n=1 Tax=Acidovorax sp. CCYZU-2555 TaxID=2835042 RepID=UPI001BCE0478|nr:response regulator transcription factor [Acidovorax sp. CCYZU-2555]MBS7777558.1 response regulator transcription factor [Acidovorax sp. CCYZU-2555]